MSNRERCAKHVLDGFHYYRCQRYGVVAEDGTLWCKQHAPHAEKARQDAADRRERARHASSSSDASDLRAYRALGTPEALRDVVAAGRRGDMMALRDALAKLEAKGDG